MSNSQDQWMPSISMPPAGFGVVRPQPSGSVPSNSFIGAANMVGNVSSPQMFPSQKLQYQQVNIPQLNNVGGPSQQQQYSVQHQKNNSEQITKQRKLEQKEKLMEFNKNKSKIVTADTMIQNILSHPQKTQQNGNQNRGTKTTSYPVNNVPQSQEMPKQLPNNYPTNENGPLRLPSWLLDASKIPEIYAKAGGLVESHDGWVDTSRAYMLLMKTNLSPPLLGVLWEMVNRQEAGRLRMTEFYGLLALVAILQGGRQITSADILTSLAEPLYPFIDHPCLSQIANQQSAPTEQPITTQLPTLIPDDDFDDFVSAPFVKPDILSQPKPDILSQPKPDILTQSKPDILSQPKTDILSQPKPDILSQPKPDIFSQPIPDIFSLPKPYILSKPKPDIPSELKPDKAPTDPKMNLPTLGNSPDSPPDDFADFQSAFTDTATSGDKYAAFRDITYDQSLLDTGIITSGTLQTDIVETGYSDDPFGEFEEAPGFEPFQASFPIDQKPVDIMTCVAEPADEDDFGDFISSTNVFSHDNKSLASLELSGLELNLTNHQSPVIDPPISTQLSSDMTQLTISNENHFNNDFSFDTISNKSLEAPVLECVDLFPVADKYSLMREEVNKTTLDDPQIEAWRKCLEGCKNVLSQGQKILESISHQTLLEKVLQTSQMQDYLLDLNEVWKVSQRILTSCQRLSSSASIQDLLCSNQALWASIISITEERFDKCDQLENEVNTQAVCSLCLNNSGASLVYSGLFYHPPCANLWLNSVDLTLPTLSMSTDHVM